MKLKLQNRQILLLKQHPFPIITSLHPLSTHFSFVNNNTRCFQSNSIKTYFWRSFNLFLHCVTLYHISGLNMFKDLNIPQIDFMH